MDRHAGEDDEVYDDDDSDDEEGYDDEDEDEDEDEDVEDEDDYDDEDGSDSDDEDGSNSEEDEWLRGEEVEQIVKNWSNSAAEPEIKEVVLLEEGLGGKLSEDVVCGILTWLPSRAQARFRCVCSRWNRLLSSSSPSIELEHSGRGKRRPSCLITWSFSYNPKPPRSQIFSHAEHKWFHIPFLESSCLDLSWNLAHADAGLLCYTAMYDQKCWFRVCNPMTNSYQVLPSTYPLSDAQMDNYQILRLVVDRAAKTFKVILLLCGTYATRDLHMAVVFDSRTNSWTDFPFVASQWDDIQSLFVRKNVIYLRTSHPIDNIVETFDIDSGEWGQMDVDLPCGNFRRGHFISSNNDRVMVVDTSRRGEEPVRVWKHLDNLPDNSVPIFSARRWKKVIIEPHSLLRSLLGNVDHCFSDGSEYLCFVLCSVSQYCSVVRYTFATRKWDVMQRSGLPGDKYQYWFVWEPSLDMVLSSRGIFDYSDHPQLERHHRSLNEFYQEDLKRQNLGQNM